MRQFDPPGRDDSDGGAERLVFSKKSLLERAQSAKFSRGLRPPPPGQSFSRLSVESQIRLYFNAQTASAEVTTMDVLEMCTHEVTDEDDGVGSGGDGESGGDGDGEGGSGGGGDGDDGGDRLAQETRVCIADAYRRASRGKGRAIPYPYASPNRAKGVSGIFTIRLRVVRIGGLPDLTFKSFEWSLRSNFV